MTDLFKAQPLEDPQVDNIQLDENVVAAIPEGHQAISIHTSGHGASYWTRTACIRLQLPNDENEKKYFLKVAAGDRGRGVMEGEFESMKSNSDLHFFVCDFHDMDGELPELKSFAASLAKLHRESISPTGKFGFHVTTYNGNIPQDVRWTNTWEECFVNGTKKDFEMEKAARGPSEELEALMIPLFEKVIPRLLRPLETGGRTLKPCFVHGDLWYGNGKFWHYVAI
ncbi:MAG: hypothetical protein M1812_008138 [Candelaria pacifica]|nr:MAG: hypothetical protein M1812_008138 [Candelaria pacifica]